MGEEAGGIDPRPATTVEVDQLDLNKKITYVYTTGDESVTLVLWDDAGSRRSHF
jgi:hypothetical protein